MYKYCVGCNTNLTIGNESLEIKGKGFCERCFSDLKNETGRYKIKKGRTGK